MKISLSVTIGVFIAVMPVWGFQMLISFGLAYLLKLNKFVTVVASNISIPPMLPLILFLSYITGGLIIGYNPHSVKYSSGISLEWVKGNLVQYLVGSLVFGILLAFVLGSVTWLVLRIFRKPKIDNEMISTEEQP
jgi:uncharacterized protein (DUF2062 family)